MAPTADEVDWLMECSMDNAQSFPMRTSASNVAIHGVLIWLWACRKAAFLPSPGFLMHLTPAASATFLVPSVLWSSMTKSAKGTVCWPRSSSRNGSDSASFRHGITTVINGAERESNLAMSPAAAETGSRRTQDQMDMAYRPRQRKCKASMAHANAASHDSSPNSMFMGRIH